MIVSISCSRKISELKEICENLNLEVKPSGKNGRFMKDDYVKVLREYYLNKIFKGKDNAPTSLKLMLELETPMLACQQKDAKPEQVKIMWDDDNKYSIEEKMDGARMLTMIFNTGGFSAFSRNNSDTNYLPIPYNTKIYTGTIDWTKIEDTFILDNEIICTNPNVKTSFNNLETETGLQAVTSLLALNKEDTIRIQKEYNRPLKFMAFDCIYWNGEWIMDKPLKERREYLIKAVQQMIDAGFNIEVNKWQYNNKKAFYKNIIKNGGEGCIIKDATSVYKPTSSRAHRSWIKCKKTMSEMLSETGTGDTIDGWISGYLPGEGKNEGKIGSFEVSINLQCKDGSTIIHKIAYIGGIDDALRDDMTLIDENGNVTMNPKYYGKIVEVDGYGISSRVMRLRHATLIRFRNDKSQDDCIYTEEFLKSMIL